MIRKIRFKWLFLLFVFSCSMDKNALQGVWHVSAFYENGQAVEVPMNEISLELLPNGTYSFKSAYKYSEAGDYKATMNFLIFNDTTVYPRKEKLIKVLYLSQDTLKLRMMKDGKEQVLFMAK